MSQEYSKFPKTWLLSIVMYVTNYDRIEIIIRVAGRAKREWLRSMPALSDNNNNNNLEISLLFVNWMGI